MIELAPDHKIGLPLDKPALIAAGCGGYGPEYRHLLDLSDFGAFVTNPITLRPQRGRSQPRLGETQTGLILNTGHQNPGVKKVIRDYSQFWQSLPIPVIAHLPAEEPDDLRRTTRALDSAGAVAAVELGIPPDAFPDEIGPWLRAIRAGGLLPLLTKVPLGVMPDVVEAIIDSGTDALVIGTPPLAAAPLPDDDSLLTGHLYGPTLHPLALYDIQRLAAWVDVPLIATGGIHSLADAQAFLTAGAVAVQLDTLLWRDPQQAAAVARSLAETTQAGRSE